MVGGNAPPVLNDAINCEPIIENAWVAFRTLLVIKKDTRTPQNVATLWNARQGRSYDVLSFPALSSVFKRFVCWRLAKVVK